ncbi:MAG: HNH endonuclease signature motif containing protein [Bacteroidota bacterium]
MKSISPKKITEKSELNYDYKTIRVTKSRISKGLLAIPRGFTNYLPKLSQRIKIYLDDSLTPQIKTFSSYYSSTNENRIGGLKDWFSENQICEGDELVLQILDKERFIYRLFTESTFIRKTNEFQKDFDNSEDNNIASQKIERISNLTQVEKSRIIYNEFLRLSNYSNEEMRRRIKISNRFNKERTPPNIKIILGNIYHGLCQVCSFSFLKKDANPYYEIHHLEPYIGHHPKNLVLVCANCHRQFEYAVVKKKLNEEGWLLKVIFNQKEYFVKQAINEIEKQDFLKTVFL